MENASLQEASLQQVRQMNLEISEVEKRAVSVAYTLQGKITCPRSQPLPVLSPIKFPAQSDMDSFPGG